MLQIPSRQVRPAELGLDQAAAFGAHGLALIWRHRGQAQDGAGQRGRIGLRHDEAVDAVADHQLVAGGRRADYRPGAGHRIQHADVESIGGASD